jgi:hypothetical protein
MTSFYGLAFTTQVETTHTHEIKIIFAGITWLQATVHGNKDSPLLYPALIYLTCFSISEEYALQEFEGSSMNKIRNINSWRMQNQRSLKSKIPLF